MAGFRLDLPPSSNDLVRPAFMEDLKCVYCGNRPPKRPVVRLVATGEAKDFRKRAHRCLPEKPVAGPVELYVTVYLPTISSDGLNRIKALEDAINGRLWWDDKQIAEWHVKRIITDDTSLHGVVFHVQAVDPTDADHFELRARLARSSIGAAAADRRQEKLFTEHPRAVVPSKPPDAPAARAAPQTADRRAVLPEPLVQRINRLARPAVISNRDDEGEP